MKNQYVVGHDSIVDTIGITSRIDDAYIEFVRALSGFRKVA